MENPIKMDDLGVPLFSETAIYINEIDLPKVLEQLAKHRRKAPAVKDTVLNSKAAL